VGLFLGPHAAGVRARGARGTPDELELELGRDEPMGRGRSYTHRTSYGMGIGMGMGNSRLGVLGNWDEDGGGIEIR
jgi:hypothetical protein